MPFMTDPLHWTFSVFLFFETGCPIAHTDLELTIDKAGLELVALLLTFVLVGQGQPGKLALCPVPVCPCPLAVVLPAPGSASLEV